MTHTRRIARLTLDAEALAGDMANADRFRYSDAYSEFTCGSWKGSALCNGSGDLYDTRIVDYEGPYQVTEHGRQMPYVLDLIGRHFRTEHLRFVRLGRIAPGSVMVPHRDYLELDESLTRIHIPLHTSPECFSSDGETIYQMALGDVWFIDAAQPHSAVSFATEDRTHLILDFTTATVEEALAFTPDADAGIPEEVTFPRAPLTDAQRLALEGLSAVVDTHNYRDVLALVIKQYFRSDISVAEIFDIVERIAKNGGATEAAERIQWLRTHALVTRLD
ncbi:aspartyl/asparaginyl beta-hydroxylase domain-containing protein [Kitasatospora brasiliensis]|uniref:aspartyl/asparaginyl beta-hydroxylase domain-containing protein n=1 Tax=Kitasatospora brasiliensis TaxID=3058040 RepID=UPI00293158DA|nr:aspartyl/asparaginyl beta-hydroxylase domain-containing protein [Kitasatospora sp. K002]